MFKCWKHERGFRGVAVDLELSNTLDRSKDAWATGLTRLSEEGKEEAEGRPLGSSRI